MPDSNEQSSAAGEYDIRLGPDLAEALKTLSEAVERFTEAESIGGALPYRLNLVLDELVTNCVTHSLRDVANPHLRVRLSRGEDAVAAEVEDNGAAFDPLTEAPAPDTSLEVKDRPIGGLGVYFVKEFTDDASYERSEGLNRIKMRMELATGADA